MNNKLPPQEPMVRIPIGMDCRAPQIEYFMPMRKISLDWMKELYPLNVKGNK